MPGGYDGYLDSLRWVAESVQEAPPSRVDLARRIADQFDLTPKSADNRVGFLRRVGLIQVDSGVVILPEFMKSWLRGGDPTSLMVQLHQRLRFVGEMLAALDAPMRTAELLQWACDRYGFNWTTSPQIDLRRGWMQSAGLMREERGLLYRTDAGTHFLDLVTVEEPSEGQGGDLGTAEDDKSKLDADRHVEAHIEDQDESQSDSTASVIRGEIIEASTDSSNPARFERAVRNAFRLLGFAAEHLGGSGQTDVLLDARLGRDASYRVAIDAKTTSGPSLQDQQVDWDTLGDHRKKHEADHSMLIAPNPSAGRLMEHADRHDVAVLSAESLAGLCDLHAEQPLGLLDYKSMFEQNGEVDLTAIEELAQQACRVVALAQRLLHAMADLTRDLGPLTASQLLLTMYHQDREDLPTRAEIDEVLVSLASPLVGAIQGDPDKGYVVACSPAVTAERLRILGEALSAS